jgi:hypothetical protein
MVPSLATATLGKDDFRLDTGTFRGIWFTRIGADQVNPSSDDIEKATSLF